MSGRERDDIPMLWDTDPSTNRGAYRQKYTGRSVSMIMPVSTSYDADDSYVSHTGPLRGGREVPLVPMSGPLLRSRMSKSRNDYGIEGRQASAIASSDVSNNDWGVDDFGTAKNEHLLRSGPLGMCNNPYFTSCPAAYPAQAAPRKNSLGLSSLESRLYNILHGDAKGWASRTYSFVKSYFPVMHPLAKKVQQWNRFFVISCLVAIFIDPLFFFVLSVNKEYKCIKFDISFAAAIAAVRSVTDIIYLLHMLLQFRLAYVAPESRVVGSGDFVDEPKKIALHYLCGYFLVDLFVVLPLPQVMILVVIPEYVGTSVANYAKNLLRATVLLQYVPRIIRFLPLVGGQFIFESAWANFVINLLMFVLAGHVVGSCWYLFGLQRVNQCLRGACLDGKLTSDCGFLIDCHTYNVSENLKLEWKEDYNSANCFMTNETFNYGIYENAVLITTENNIAVRYTYSLFWGFQQISTLAGNQVPSSFVWEVLFTMGIIGLGLLLFALLIGNMQNFLQALGRRRLEMQLRRRDVERWMSHRRLPETLRNLVREAERFNWAATCGVNEQLLLENLPENLQSSIRRHLFSFLKKVRIFTLMDDTILDVICERLRQKLFLSGSNIFDQGASVEKMVFIARGRVQSIGTDGNVSLLSEGDVCGEELLTWYLEHSSVNKDGGKIKFPWQRLISNRTVNCITNVEAFALRSADLEDVTLLFARFLRNPRVQGAIRYESPYWRTRAATLIQVAWRYRKRRLIRSSGQSANGSFHANSYVQQR